MTRNQSAWRFCSVLAGLHSGVGIAFTFLLAGCTTSSNSPVESNKQAPAIPLFVDVTEKAGIDFQHHAGGSEDYFFPAIMGPGGAFFDFDRDGDLDILLVDSGNPPDRTTQPVTAAPALDSGSSCRLFRQDPDFQFVDVSKSAGLVHKEYGMGAAIADVNNDGFPDVYCTNYGPDRIFLNQRDGTFADVTQKSGINNIRWATSAAFFDYDRDGWLDLYVANYVDYDPAQPCRITSGQRDFCNPAIFRPTAAKLYRNVTGQSGSEKRDGPNMNVVFEDISLASGIALKSGAGLGVVTADFNEDQWPDVFVANDGTPNFLWINQRDGTFREDGVLAGVAYDKLGHAQGSMGIAVGDLNADRLLDLFVTNLDGEYNAVYLGEAGGSFQDASAAAGLVTPSFPRTGFGTAMVDLEHDGDGDLLVVNGRVRRISGASQATAAGSFWKSYSEPNQLFLNDGRGNFAEIAPNSSDGFLSMNAVSRGLAVGDVDNDGDLDSLVTVTGGRAALLLNEVPKKGHWLQIQATDPRHGGRDAYGATVTIRASERSWVATVSPGASYLNSHDPRLHFGLGQAETFESIEILWPDGSRETFDGGSTDRLVKVEYGSGRK